MNPDKLKLVTFRVGDDSFAADIFTVERVLRHLRPRPVPDVPSWIEGVIDYQGKVVPVIDLRARFGAEGERPESARILVCTVGTEWVAMTVDAVHEVATVSSGEIEAPPAVFRGLAREYLKGLVRRADAVLVVLDVAHLLTSQEQLQLDRALNAGAAQ